MSTQTGGTNYEYFYWLFAKNLLTKSLNVHIYTDSDSMIKSFDKMNKYPTAKYKMTLHPEWDVLSALNMVLDTFRNRLNIEWVQLHQDDNVEENENKNRLELSAELNVMADELATIGL